MNKSVCYAIKQYELELEDVILHVIVYDSSDIAMLVLLRTRKYVLLLCLKIKFRLILLDHASHTVLKKNCPLLSVNFDIQRCQCSGMSGFQEICPQMVLYKSIGKIKLSGYFHPFQDL